MCLLEMSKAMACFPEASAASGSLKSLHKRFLRIADRWDVLLEAQKVKDSEVQNVIAADFKAQFSSAEGSYKPLLAQAVSR